MTGVEVSLVLPAFDCAPYIGASVQRAVQYFEEHGILGEVVVADDGSTDGTADAVPTAANVLVLRLPHRGKGGALRAGMTAAHGHIRAFTDADLPYGLEPLARARQLIDEGRAHAVIGDRTLPGSAYRSTRLRRVLSGFAGLAFRTLVGGEIRDTQCGFKCFRGDVAAEVFRIARVDGFAIDIEVLLLLLRYGLDVRRIPVRLEGEAVSSVHLLRDSGRAARDVVAIRLDWAAGHYRSGALERIRAADERTRDAPDASEGVPSPGSRGDRPG